jgi:hypothetical protein
MLVFWEKVTKKRRSAMNSIPAKRSSSTHVWIPIGAGLFLVALAVSAAAVPQLRLLHLLQALIYVAVVTLARRNSVFALGTGFTIAVARNCLEFFGPQLIQASAVLFWTFLHTGQVRHDETMMVTVGGIGHLVLIFACPTALFNQTTDTRKWWRFLDCCASAVVATKRTIIQAVFMSQLHLIFAAQVIRRLADKTYRVIDGKLNCELKLESNRRKGKVATSRDSAVSRALDTPKRC